jgi:hypothetical protein
MTDPGISLRTRFERFPATVKGAFVLRGEDADPHQVRVRGSRVIRLPAGEGRGVPMEPVTVDVPPHQDVFVPFELPIGELESGWYGFLIELDVDGSPRTAEGDRRFAIPWPRGTLRTGTVKVDRSVALGEAGVRVDRLQSTADSTTLRFEVTPPGPVTVGLRADGRVLDVLSVQVDGGGGEGVVVAYPLPRGARRLAIVFGRGDDRAEVAVPLA